MEHSDSDEYTIKPNLALRYQKSFDAQGKPVFRSNFTPRGSRGGPHGGGYSTATDLVKFERALRLGKLLKPEDVQILLSAKPELGATQYGYGFDVNESRGIVGHGGGSAGISDNLDIFVRSEWTAVVLSNYTEATFEVCEPVVEKIRELVAE
jgi:hypothetical protein